MSTTKTVHHELPAVAGRRLQLDIDKGRVQIRTGTGDAIRCEIALTAEARNEAEARALLERVDLAFGQTTVRCAVAQAEQTGQGSRQQQVGRIDADVTITVPCRQDIVLRNGVGTIEIERLEGNVHVRSGAGDVWIAAVEGEVLVEGGSGSIEVRDVTQRITAKSKAGDVTLRRIGGPIQVATLAGEVSAEIVRPPGADSRITTVAGGISIALAPSVGLDLHARTGLGGMSVRVPSGVRTDRPGRTVHTLYGGGSRLSIRTMVGRVRIDPLSAP